MTSRLIPKAQGPVHFIDMKKSAGILDDFAVRKNVATKEGTIEHVPTADNHIVNKKYVDGNYVPYTGATGDVDLGANKLIADELHVITPDAPSTGLSISRGTEDNKRFRLSTSQGAITGHQVFVNNTTPTMKIYTATGTETESSGIIGEAFTSGDIALMKNVKVGGDFKTIGTITGSNLSGTNTGDEDLSGLVPYTGASGAVNLGANNLTIDTNLLFVDVTNNRVGIGTATPTVELHLKGDASNSVTYAIDVGATTNDKYAYYLFKDRGTNKYGTIYRQSTGDFYIYDYINSKTIFRYDQSLNYLLLAESGANVGIGTVTPTETLHVVGNTLVNGNITCVGSNRVFGIDGTTNAYLDIDRGATNYLAATRYKTDGTNNWWAGLSDSDVFGDGTAYFIGTSASTTAGARFVILTDGNTGIGQTAPTEKLDVNGTIIATGYKSSDGSAGISVTITTAKLTPGGSDGSMTFKNGLLTAQTAAT